MMPTNRSLPRLRFNVILAISVLGFGVLTSIYPQMVLQLAVVILLLLCAVRADTLLLAIFVFAVVSTLPGIGLATAIIEVEVTSGVTVNFFGLVRTLLAALTMGWVVLLIQKQWGLVRRHGLPFLILWGYAVVSLVWTPRWALGEGLRTIVYFSLAFGVYFVALYISSRLPVGDAQLLLWVAILALVIGIGSLINFNVLQEISEAGETNLDRGERLAGLAASPNILAGNLSIFIGLAMAFVLTPNAPRVWRQVAWGVIGVSVVPLMFTLSRSGWIGAGLAVALALALRRKWIWLTAFGMVTATILFGSSLGHRFLGDWQLALAGADLGLTRGFQNAYGRMEYLWLPALRQLTTPAGVVIGRGAGTAQAWAFGYFGVGMHSEFLQNWLDFGTLGFLIMIMGFWGEIRRAYKLFHQGRHSPLQAALGLGSLCVFAALLPKFLWDHVYNGSSSWLLFIIWGIMSGTSVQTKVR